MFRRMFGWLNVPLTSRETDAAIYLITGVGSVVLAVVGGIARMWWFAFMFALIAVSQIRLAWRNTRGRDAEPVAPSDSAGK